MINGDLSYVIITFSVSVVVVGLGLIGSSVFDTYISAMIGNV